MKLFNAQDQEEINIISQKINHCSLKNINLAVLLIEN